MQAGIDERAEVVQAALRRRRTVPLFEADDVPRDVVLRAVDLARWAPNHRLTEPWRFYLLGPETAAAVARLNARLVAQKRGEEAARNKLARWSAVPGWLAVTCVHSDDALRAKEDYAACCCAIQNLQLALWSEGVGTKWTTGAVTREPAFYDLLGIDPEAETLVGLVWYGYPACEPVPPARKLGLDDVLAERP